MAYYFSIESRKGGVGKTTVALNLGAKLLEVGYKVLLLDCDITGTSISECIFGEYNKDEDRVTVTAIDKEPHTFFELEDAEELKEEVCHNDFGPFVQRQRYTSISKLRNAKTTRDL